MLGTLLLAWAAYVAMPVANAQSVEPSQLVERFQKSFACVERGRCKVECVTSVHHERIPEGAYPDKTVFCTEAWTFASDGARTRIYKRYAGARVGEGDPAANVQEFYFAWPDTVNGFDLQAVRSHGKIDDDHWDVRGNSDEQGGKDCETRFVSAGLVGLPFGLVKGDDGKPLLRVLEESMLRVAGDEQLGQSVCSVVTGSGRYGTRTLWLARDEQYRPKRLLIVKAGGDLANTVTVASYDGSQSDGKFYPKRQLEKIACDFGGCEFEEHDGALYITGFIETETFAYQGGGTLTLTHKWRISEIDLTSPFSDADFELAAPIPDGHAVFLDNTPGIRYRWRDRTVVTDAGRPLSDAIFLRERRTWPAGRTVFVAFNGVLVVATVLFILKRRAGAAHR